MLSSRMSHIAFGLILVSALLLAACAGGTTAPSASPAAATTAPQEPAAAAPAAGSAELPIGVAVAQSSNVSLFGQEQVLGAQIAEKYFNDKGGVNGTPIKLVYQDTAGDEAGTINAFQTLINDNVIAIVGPTLSQQAFAADPFAEKAGVPVIAPSNTAQGIPEIGKYVSRVSAPVAKVAPNAIAAALKINPDIKTVAVAYAQNDAFSKSETGTFQQVITDTYKFDLATVQTFQTTDTDFTTQASNIMNVQPDLVVISGLAADGANLIKQLRDLGYTGLIVGGNGLNTANIFPVCQNQCDGILVAQAYSPQLDSAINKMLVDTYAAEQQKTPGQFTAQAFAAVQVLVEALQAVDQKTPIKDLALADLRNALNDQLLSGMTFDTPLGEISFDPEGELNQSQFYVAQIKMDSDGKTGQFVLLK
jgi:branched-chain amino acid transport system substrate-binding protein